LLLERTSRHRWSVPRFYQWAKATAS
jgi:hypothetical protein